MKKSIVLFIAIFSIFLTSNLQAQNDTEFEVKNVGDKVLLKLENDELSYEKIYNSWSELLEDEELMKSLFDSEICEETILAETGFEGNLKDGFTFHSEGFSVEYKKRKNKSGYSISIDF